MSTDAIDAQGTKLAVGDGGGPEIFTDIPEIKSFSGPGGSASIRDVSDLDSTAKEKKMGLIDEGQLGFTIHYIPDNAVHGGLRTDRSNKTLRNFKMTFTDTGSTVYSFAAYVTGFQVGGSADGDVEANVTLEISGAITES